MKVKIVLLVFCVTFCMTQPCNKLLTWQEFVDIIEDIPKDDRYDFIYENYLKGYRIVYEDHIPLEILDEKCKLSVAICIVITKNLYKNANSFKYLLETRQEICFPHPIGCINPNDPGLRP
ncbi:unnamed protein product [Ceutorhynchus assimilis]|uniref:Uncharacterized protein n=1 Tax=Ceutorhynchus assimilis TaxID=467358 RepID=A0A9N9QQZ9_9CUCU|nr:unnamed protein product [Ceutorhynchus assimilis]